MESSMESICNENESLRFSLNSLKSDNIKLKEQNHEVNNKEEENKKLEINSIKPNFIKMENTNETIDSLKYMKL